ncbi:hypothetical protein Q9L58_002886 [Maublancomyces gigas]|uniref:Uncharacterized protein n=1 Tax=Discina gigas TaxID=1032678 RepID=A0ABR3GQA9_9PEZI
MQFTTMITLLFVASAIAAPIGLSDKRQITPTGVNTFGDDGVPSKTDGKGGIVRMSDGANSATGKV